VEWAVWEEWVEWECNPQFTQTKIQKGQFLLPFFLSSHVMIIIMSKRYSGKSFKDSSVMKKAKLSLKEKRKLKKEKSKKNN